MAEREGFEPSVPVKVQHLSRVPRSTAPAPLQEKIIPFFTINGIIIVYNIICVVKQKYG